jgi:hypothetical protein
LDSAKPYHFKVVLNSNVIEVEVFFVFFKN